MNKKPILMFAISSLMLASCSYIDIFSSSTYSSSSIKTSTSTSPGTKLASTYENLFKNNSSPLSCIPTSVQSPKMLVIPVWFNDSNRYINETQKDTIIDNLNKAFFGDSSSTGWESVYSFYKKESHDKSLIQGKVSEWYNIDISLDEIGRYRTDETSQLIKNITDTYFSNHPEDLRSNYDTDHDGYLDAVSVIYAAPNKNNVKSDPTYEGRHGNFWAYTFWVQDTTLKNKDNPGINAYLWAGYDFMYESTQHCSIDAHTYIHETGHLYGLDDYYDYNLPSNYESSVAAGFSMQDLNVGGHDPYSSYALGWGNPIEANSATTYTLRPYQDSGDYLIIRENDSTSAFDEYLLLEYYSPTNLNEFDTAYQYKQDYPQGVNKYGIRMWHVDARIIQKLSGTYDEANITNTIIEGNKYRQLCTNNTYDPYNKSICSPLAGKYNYGEYRLLQLIRKGDYSSERVNSYFTENDLFIKGDTFDISLYKNQFVEKEMLNNCSDKITWSFTVNELNSDSATITLTKN